MLPPRQHRSQVPAPLALRRIALSGVRRRVLKQHHALVTALDLLPTEEHRATIPALAS